jgi:hypothetical protein
LHGYTAVSHDLGGCGVKVNSSAGIASRLSEALGLHIDARGLQQSDVISEAALKTREHAYWSLYVQDK